MQKRLFKDKLSLATVLGAGVGVGGGEGEEAAHFLFLNGAHICLLLVLERRTGDTCLFGGDEGSLNVAPPGISDAGKKHFRQENRRSLPRNGSRCTCGSLQFHARGDRNICRGDGSRSARSPVAPERCSTKKLGSWKWTKRSARKAAELQITGGQPHWVRIRFERGFSPLLTSEYVTHVQFT